MDSYTTEIKKDYRLNSPTCDNLMLGIIPLFPWETTVHIKKK